MRRSMLAFGWILLTSSLAFAEIVERPSGAVLVKQSAIVPGTPEQVYDELTGDISGWWDHNMSGDPHRFTIDARPGGLFLEVFEEGSPDGVVHATVIFAQRGKRLTFRGPLGFNGYAFDTVVTYNLSAVGSDSTRIDVECRGAGELEEGWAEALDRVWDHFLHEQFVPWVRARAEVGFE